MLLLNNSPVNIFIIFANKLDIVEPYRFVVITSSISINYSLLLYKSILDATSSTKA